jgi:hypothetical protein
VHSVLVEKPAGKCPLGRQRGWKDNIETNLKEVGYEEGRWMELADPGVRGVELPGPVVRVLV